MQVTVWTSAVVLLPQLLLLLLLRLLWLLLLLLVLPIPLLLLWLLPPPITQKKYISSPLSAESFSFLFFFFYLKVHLVGQSILICETIRRALPACVPVTTFSWCLERASDLTDRDQQRQMLQLLPRYSAYLQTVRIDETQVEAGQELVNMVRHCPKLRELRFGGMVCWRGFCAWEGKREGWREREWSETFALVAWYVWENEMGRGGKKRERGRDDRTDMALDTNS